MRWLDAEYSAETQRLERAADALGAVLKRDMLMEHERKLFDEAYAQLESGA